MSVLLHILVCFRCKPKVRVLGNLISLEGLEVVDGPEAEAEELDY